MGNMEGLWKLRELWGLGGRLLQGLRSFLSLVGGMGGFMYMVLMWLLWLLLLVTCSRVWCQGSGVLYAEGLGDLALSNCGGIIKFEKSGSSGNVYRLDLRFNGQCIDYDSLVIDVITLTVPDRFWVEDGYGNVIVETDWIWCNWDILPHGVGCIDGYVRIYPDSVVSVDYSEYSVSNFWYKEGYVFGINGDWSGYDIRGRARIVIPSEYMGGSNLDDHLVLWVRGNDWDDSIMGVYAHCLSDEFCYEVRDTVMVRCRDLSGDYYVMMGDSIVRWDDYGRFNYMQVMGGCCDTIYMVKWRDRQMYDGWWDTVLCWGDTMDVILPQWVSSYAYELSVGSVIGRVDTVISAMVYDDTCGIEIRQFIDVIRPDEVYGDTIWIYKRGYVPSDVVYGDGYEWYLDWVSDFRQSYVLSEGVYTMTYSNGMCEFPFVVIVAGDKPYYAPNIISVNSSENREFRVNFLEGSVRKFRQFSIYDRWGELVYADSDISDASELVWTCSNCNEGVYVWVLEYDGMDGGKRIAYGDFVLVR